MLLSSLCKGRHHRCILGQQCEYSRHRTSKNWFRTKIEFEKTQRRRRWCSAKNPAVPFSKWAMWMELIELRESSIQCSSYFHHVFEGALIECGKLIKPDQDAINRIKEAFEILKAPFFHASPISTRCSKCGPTLWQMHHHKARDALQSAT